MTTEVGYELGVIDRLALLDVLPVQGNYLTLKIVRELREDLSFTEEEHAQLQMEPSVEGGTLIKGDASLVVKLFTPKRVAREIIVESLTKADREKRLTPDHLRVFELFVEPED